MAFSECAMSRTQVQSWYKRFKESREDANNEARHDHTRTSTTDENIEVVESLVERLLMMLAYRSANAKQLLRMLLA